MLVISKRQYTGKDLLDDRYGRLFELPAGLARAGVAVHGICASYRRRKEGEFRFAELPNLSLQSVNLASGLIRLHATIRRAMHEFKPDVIWASSDVPMLCAGAWIAKKYGVPFVADLYDNYESFGLSRLPGAVPALRWACRRADRITVVSHTLRDYIRESYGSTAGIDVLGNGVRADIFYAGDRASARRELGLPDGARLIGTAGALVRGRGIGDLLKAYGLLAETDANLHLVLAGPRDDSISAFSGDRVIDLGILPHQKVGTLFRALDVGVICNLDSSFGRYCFPLKLHEMQASGIPVVAAAVGDVAAYLSSCPDSLYMPGDAVTLASAVRSHLDGAGRCPSLSPDGWDSVSLRLKQVLEAAVSAPV
ncbi:glycosyltransferase [Arenimonas sp.]|uniref:glycosyltransferase n=1 Tax=Arenimonas sp. TaxID=1872635 RepID=UPI002E346BC6|nr:glycosyltransferase [Arenimonas sp.]HEX4853463.1 glycosyltransferase [Arenimonas sp.]